MDSFDLIVIGSGPGGYIAAIRAAQLGLKVACIEKDKTFGGTCLNVGCIPSKALLYSSENFDKWRHHGKELGIKSSEIGVNWEQMLKRKNQVVEKLVQGISFLFRKNKVTSFQGIASFRSSHEIAIQGEKEVTIKGKSILLATGSEPTPLPFLPFDEKRILSSTGALSLPSIPKKLLMIGAGVIGLELGSVFQRLGSEVTVIEMMERVCPTLDYEISHLLLKMFKKQGMDFHLSTQVIKGKKNENGVQLFVRTSSNEEKTLEGDNVLVAIGRRPYSKDLGLEKEGVQLDNKGRVIVDGYFRTSIPHIFAIGDLIDGPMLAHKASDEGVAVVEYLAGHIAKVDYLAIPNVMYTWPEVACVGFSEEEAKKHGLEILIGKAPFAENPRARCSGDSEGLVKIIGESKSGQILGMHIIGPYASEMIGEGALAIKKRMTLKEIAHSSHAHPTYSEAIKEAAESSYHSKTN